MSDTLIVRNKSDLIGMIYIIRIVDNSAEAYFLCNHVFYLQQGDTVVVP